jgi:hypothetical protein
MKVTKKLVTEITESIVAKGFALDISWDKAPMVHEIVGYALEAAKRKWEPEVNKPVMVVWANNNDRRLFLGHATGAAHDIESYYEERKGYGLELEPVEITHVESGYKAHKDNIIAKRDRLQAELDQLNLRLKSGKISK